MSIGIVQPFWKIGNNNLLHTLYLWHYLKVLSLMFSQNLTNLPSCRMQTAKTNPAQGSVGIFNGDKLLKMEGWGNRIFPSRSENAPGWAFSDEI